MDNKEIWKPIKGYEDCYEVSNLGNIRSLTRLVYYSNGHYQTKKGQNIKPQKTIHGYYQVELHKDRQKQKKTLHTIVAETFIPNPNNYKEINHKDHNRTNNCVYNLEWCTREENILDMVLYNKKIGKYGNRKKYLCPICGEKRDNKAKVCRKCYLIQIKK